MSRKAGLGLPGNPGRRHANPALQRGAFEPAAREDSGADEWRGSSGHGVGAGGWNTSFLRCVANSRRIFIVSSVDPSSDAMSCQPVKVWADRLASCAGRWRAPFSVASATIAGPLHPCDMAGFLLISEPEPYVPGCLLPAASLRKPAGIDGFGSRRSPLYRFATGQ